MELADFYQISGPAPHASLGQMEEMKWAMVKQWQNAVVRVVEFDWPKTDRCICQFITPRSKNTDLISLPYLWLSPMPAFCDLRQYEDIMASEAIS